MKTLYGLVIFMLISAALSQTAYSQVNFGVKAGLNFASVKFEGVEVNGITKFSGGVVSEIGFNSKLFLRPELLYAIKGWGFSDEDGSMSLHYFNVPVLLGFRPVPQFSILAGPEFGYLLKVARKPDFPSTIPPYEEFDYAIALGASYNVVQQLSLDVRYTHGFDTLLKADGRDNHNNPTGEVFRDGANRVFFVGVTWFFTNNE